MQLAYDITIGPLQGLLGLVGLEAPFFKCTLETSRKDVKLHSETSREDVKLHSEKCGEDVNYTRNELRRCETTLETSGEDVIMSTS